MVISVEHSQEGYEALLVSFRVATVTYFAFVLRVATPKFRIATPKSRPLSRVSCRVFRIAPPKSRISPCVLRPEISHCYPKSRLL